MKYIFCFFTLVFGLQIKSVSAQNTFDAKLKSVDLINKFKAQKFHEVYVQMDETMKRQIDEEQLEAIWVGLEMQFDSILKIEESTEIEVDSMVVTITPVQFKSIKLGLKFAFNNKQQISGFYIVPVNFSHQVANYVNTSVFYEIKKNIPSRKFPSEGILTLPDAKKNLPVIIIVGGSGPTDKDLTVGPNKIYKDLAWGLAAKGIAVYRYDKRTVKFGSAIAKNKKATVKQEYLEDLKMIVKMLGKMPTIDPAQIYVLGHSEGGYLIPYFAKNIQGIKGFICKAGNYNLLGELLPYQYTYLANHSKSAQEKEAILALLPKAIYARDRFTKNSPKDSLPTGFTTPYLFHLNENCPEKLLSYIQNYPLLLLQGARDYQVPVTEFNRWKQALSTHPNTTFKLYPDLNHLFLPGKGDSVPSEYMKTGNVPEVVIDDLVNWVLKK